MKALLEKRFAFTYKASFSNGLHEHELDHVFFGKSETIPLPDPTEVSEWRYQGITELEAAMKARPAEFTAWLHRALPLVIKELELERA